MDLTHSKPGRWTVEWLAEADTETAVDVLCDAFADYPVMRYVVGSANPSYDRHLRALIGFFVRARVWRAEPILAVIEGGRAAAVATITPPGDRQPRPALADLHEATWHELGAAARARYDAFGAAGQQFTVHEPHHHLNLIGVRSSRRGQGLGRILLDAVHRISAEDPGSVGVGLATEDQANVALYEHVGYEVIGHARLSPGLETWAMFRPD